MKIRLLSRINKRVEYKNLTLGKVYEVLAIEPDSYMIMNDKEEPILYPFGWFDVIDPRVPVDWIYYIDKWGHRCTRIKSFDMDLFGDWHQWDENICDKDARLKVTEYLKNKPKDQYKKNSIQVNGKEFQILERELHLSEREGSLWLFLKCSLFKGGGFGFWEIRLNDLKSIDDLDGKRLHIDNKWDPCDDDTLGTEVWMTKNYLDFHCLWLDRGGEDFYHFGEILIDFQRVNESSFRLKIRMPLTKSLEDPENLESKDFPYLAIGDFEAAFDTVQPEVGL